VCLRECGNNVLKIDCVRDRARVRTCESVRLGVLD
jgi:hypothetical protein